MKIAALTIVTLYILYWTMNVMMSVPNDPCWAPDGRSSDRVSIAVLVIAPVAASLMSLVVLWYYL